MMPNTRCFCQHNTDLLVQSPGMEHLRIGICFETRREERTERFDEPGCGHAPGRFRNPARQVELAELVLIGRGQLREEGIGRIVGTGRGLGPG